MPTVEALMKECGVSPSELSKIVVAKGPGSYTGVRIGVTIAKHLRGRCLSRYQLFRV